MPKVAVDSPFKAAEIAQSGRFCPKPYYEYVVVNSGYEIAQTDFIFGKFPTGLWVSVRCGHVTVSTWY